MRKLVVLLVFAMILLGSVPVYAMPSINGQSAILIDATSGQVLYDKDMGQRMHPASTTKILTAIIAIESGRLDEKVTIGPNPPRIEGTRVYLEEGEQITLKELVQAAMIHSANDAALAIAEFLANTEAEFAQIMNTKAAEIGAVNSHFSNSHGLSEDDHYVTAYDLALIGRYAMQNETFRKIAESKILDWQGQAWQTRLININKMLWNYKGSNGLKTGYTTKAKYTIIASAQRDTRSYIAVVLGCSGNNHWSDASTLLDFGFKDFQQVRLANPEEVVATLELNKSDKLEVVPRQELSLSLPLKEEKAIESQLYLQPLADNIPAGQVVGEQVFTVDGQEAARVELLAANEITPAPKPLYNTLLNILLYILAGLFVLQVIYRCFRHFKKGSNGRRRRYTKNRRSWNY